ncbi:MAG: ABC transporter ATP-binding protein [Deltaproteobacteria bacterium]|nr:ABC transporter ATP-binding protein [Deltaproteobacteria bacterium]
MNKIVVSNLRKHFILPDRSRLDVVGDLSFQVEDGEFLSILGPSGCGKSTLLSILAGLESLSGGEILINERPVVPGEKGIRLGFVFQQPRLLNWRSVRENVRLPLEHGSLSRDEQLNVAQRYLELARLQGFENYFPLQISGGMQQRAAIARALAIEPEVLLMDEPFSSLDELTARKMRKELLRIWQETRKTIIFVTHDISEAVYLSNRLLVVTERPTRVYETLTIDVGYPRDYDDDRLFEMTKKVSRLFLQMEEEHDES